MEPTVLKSEDEDAQDAESDSSWADEDRMTHCTRWSVSWCLLYSVNEQGAVLLKSLLESSIFASNS